MHETACQQPNNSETVLHAAGPAHAAIAPRTCSKSFWSCTSPLPGWVARRGARPIARLLASAATPQTARQGTCPKGWSEIGRLDAPAACMGMSPCGASEASTPSDCTPMQSPKRLGTGSENLWTIARARLPAGAVQASSLCAQRAILNKATVTATWDSSNAVGTFEPKAMRSSMGQIWPGLLAVRSLARLASRKLPKRASLRPSIC